MYELQSYNICHKDVKAIKQCKFVLIGIPKRPDTGSTTKNAPSKPANSVSVVENHSSTPKTKKRNLLKAGKLTKKFLKTFKTLPKEKKQYILANWPGLALGTGGMGLTEMGALDGSLTNGLLDNRQNLGGFGGAANLNGLDGLVTTSDAESLNGIKSYLGDNYNTPSNTGLAQMNGLNGLDSGLSLTNLAGMNSLGQGTTTNANSYGISKLLGTDSGGFGQASNLVQNGGLLANQQANDISQGNIENIFNDANGLVNGQQQPLNTNNKQFIGDCKWQFFYRLID